jgi:hypothetical protein
VAIVKFMPQAFIPNPNAADGQSITTIVPVVNIPVIFVADPNSEGLKPADPTKPCYGYSCTVSVSSMNWNPNTQLWQ